MGRPKLLPGFGLSTNIQNKECIVPVTSSSAELPEGELPPFSENPNEYDFVRPDKAIIVIVPVNRRFIVRYQRPGSEALEGVLPLLDKKAATGAWNKFWECQSPIDRPIDPPIDA